MDGLAKKKTIFFDIKCHNSYIMKCLYNNITQNDTIWWYLYLPHLVSNIKTTSNQCNTLYNNIIKIIHPEKKPYDKSVHTGEEPYIYYFIIVSLINNPGSQE